MNIKEESKVYKTSNYPEQRLLTELDLLEHLERHYAGNRATRIYVAPRCYIKSEFFEQALRGMLISFECKEKYEACARVLKLIRMIERRDRHSV